MKFLKSYGPCLLALLVWFVLMGSVQRYLIVYWGENGRPWWIIVTWGALFGLGIPLIFALFAPRQYCPNCGARLPRFFKPHGFSWRLLGSWSCPACHTLYDRHSRILKQPAA